MVASRETFPLLAELLAEQQRLDTPVARFAASQPAGPVGLVAPARPQLIPLTRPGPGEQYAFEVDLDSCTGCKSCVSACHSLNGLDETETWRDVGLMISADRRHPFAQTVTSACHHCADPACLNGCPVLAYEKDPVTGIVRHLDDQCIGCSYCVLKCPYDAPKYSARLGIVRKCDMCHGRLAAGEAPACAQACPTHAIRITTVPVETTSAFLTAAPAADYTRPTTRYVSGRKFPAALVAADHAALRPQPAHVPLAVMLTLLPVALGLTLAEHRRVALSVLLVGLSASILHLGQPWRAWRIFLGWRRSWLTREALVGGAWLSVAAASVAIPWLQWASATLGILTLACSAMIYVDTRRNAWSARETFPRLFLTGGIVLAALTLPSLAAPLLIAKLAWESRTFFGPSPSARLQRGVLGPVVLARDSLGLLAAVLFAVGHPYLALPPMILGEFADRLLFFRGVDAPKMPGMPAPVS